MNQLRERLDRASGVGPVGFGSDDIRQRVTRRRRRTRAVGSTAGVLLLALVATAMWTGRDDDRIVTGDGDRSTDVSDLVRRDWQLVEITIDGDRWVLPTSMLAWLGFDSDSVGAHSCNYFGAPVQAGPGTLGPGPEPEGYIKGMTTLIGCDDGRERADEALKAAYTRATSWHVAGDELTLEGPGVRAAFRDEILSIDEGYTREAVVLASGGLDTSGPQWQIAYHPPESEGATATLGTYTRDHPGSLWGTSGIAVGPNLEAPLPDMEGSAGPFGDGHFFFGHAPPGTVTVRYILDDVGGELPVFDTPPEAGVVVYGGFVYSPPGGTAIALDAEGRELARTTVAG